MNQLESGRSTLFLLITNPPDIDKLYSLWKVSKQAIATERRQQNSAALCWWNRLLKSAVFMPSHTTANNPLGRTFDRAVHFPPVLRSFLEPTILALPSYSAWGKALGESLYKISGLIGWFSLFSANAFDWCIDHQLEETSNVVQRFAKIPGCHSTIWCK